MKATVLILLIIAILASIVTVKLLIDTKQQESLMRKTSRRATYPVLDLIIDRWSPRAMSGESVSREELMSLFEAARWAPSAYNNQPWRFIYATRDGKDWHRFLDLLVPANRAWADKAGALIVIVSHTLFDYNQKPSKTHSFDTGSVWENLALQGSAMGLVIYAMEGFDYDRARTELTIPESFAVEAMVAVGKPGSPDELPERDRGSETPSDRKPLSEIAFEGTFKSNE